MKKTMDKGEFVNYIADQHKCTKTKAEKTIDMFTSSVIDAIGKGKEISLIGFGQFSISKILRLGKSLKMPAIQNNLDLSVITRYQLFKLRYKYYANWYCKMV